MAGQRCRERDVHPGGRARRARPRGLTARRLATLAAAGAATLLAACGGEGGTTGLEDGLPPIHAGGPGSEQRERDPAVVGSWSRTILVTGASGFLQSSETRWTFHESGRMERRLVTIDFGFGLGDQVVTTGSWTTSGSRSGAGVLTVRYDGAGDVGASFDYRVTDTFEGTFLHLDSLVFQRVSP